MPLVPWAEPALDAAGPVGGADARCRRCPRTRRGTPPVAFPLVDGDDDDAEVDAPLGSPLHPDDRLWRHPSELASAGLPSALQPPGQPDPASQRRRARRPRSATAPAAAAVGSGTVVRPRDRLVPVVLAGTVGALLTAGLLALTGSFDRGLAPAPAAGPATSSTMALAVRSQAAAPGVADLADRLRPSLLALAGTTADGRPARGTAIAIRTGHVVTAARLVAGSGPLEVLVEGVGRRGTIVGADADTDLAVVAVEGGGLKPVSWGAAADLRPGDPAVAVSSPPGGEPGPTVTAGVVSGINRTLAAAGTELRGLLQVDRPVPTEGAGGGLVDQAGALVGVTLPAAASAPFGYAVPAEVAKDVVRQLLARGRVARAWLGVEGGDRGVSGGAVVQRVRPGSPAAAAGLLEGDVVTAINGRTIPSMGMLLLALRLHQPGETVRLLVVRAGRQVEVLATLADRA